MLIANIVKKLASELTHALEALHHGGNPEQVLQQFAHRLTQN